MTTTAASKLGHRTVLTGVNIGLMAILSLAVVLRLRGIGFGLPALYDPDEPIFLLTALKLLRDGTLNPGWFGHPGTTTIYALAVVDLVVLGAGLLTGRFAGVQGFARAIYADPSVVVLPGRWFMVACAIATIVLTFVLARRLFGARTGLLAATFLAVDPVHIKYSQIVRTDMHETVFLLLCVLASVKIARQGRTRDYLWAAVWLGFACATKWPAITVAAAIMGAAGYRMARDPAQSRTHFSRLVLAGPMAFVALVAASPFLLLDFSTVLANVTAETRTHHPGSTGHGAWANAWWYLAHPLRDALGVLGVIMATTGLFVAARRSSAFAVTIVPVVIVSLVAISVQALVWERWIVPLLPFVTIALAALVDASTRRWNDKLGKIVYGGLVALIVVPALMAGNAAAVERANDTRAQASAWARTHIPHGSSVIVEQLSFDLLGAGWRFLFPVGDAGCVDVAASLRAKIPYATIERWRAGRPIVDFGTIAPSTFATCRADYAIVVDYDRYLMEPIAYAAELRLYRALIARGGIVATFRPEPGRVGGPIVRILRLDPRSAGWGSDAAGTANRPK